MKNKKKRKKQDGLLKEVATEAGGYILGEIMMRILLFIPRLIIRLIKYMY